MTGRDTGTRLDRSALASDGADVPDWRGEHERGREDCMVAGRLGPAPRWRRAREGAVQRREGRLARERRRRARVLGRRGRARHVSRRSRSHGAGVGRCGIGCAIGVSASRATDADGHDAEGRRQTTHFLRRRRRGQRCVRTQRGRRGAQPGGRRLARGPATRRSTGETSIPWRTRGRDGRSRGGLDRAAGRR